MQGELLRNQRKSRKLYTGKNFSQGLLHEGGDRVVVPWYQRGGTWYNIVQMWWNLVPKVGVPAPSLDEPVPIKVSSLDDLGIPRTNFKLLQCRQ